MFKNLIQRAVSVSNSSNNLKNVSRRVFSTETKNISKAPKTAFTTEGKISRPISPELAIWKFSPAAYVHVGVRITGCVLAGAFTVLGLMHYLPWSVPYVLDVAKLHAPALVVVAKTGIAFTLAYHAFGGYRQLYQDFTAKGFTHSFHNRSSLAMVAFALLATLASLAIPVTPNAAIVKKLNAKTILEMSDFNDDKI